MKAISENLVDGGFLLSFCSRFKGGVEEAFDQKIKAWYNGIKDRDFEDIS
jgi:hypothetical protein